MARIKLLVPEHFAFETIIPIRITDLNYGGHVGNDTILSLLHEARMQFLRYHEYTEMSFEQYSLIMGDVAIEFKSELFYGDSIKAFVSAADFSSVGFDLYYKLVRISDKAIIAIAKTGMICFDYTSRKVRPLPQKAKEKIQS
jgi:acyl-CoA thioesterase FadM